MTETSVSKDFSSMHLKPEELEEILRRIDENLALRPLMHGNSSITEPSTTLGGSSVPTDLSDLYCKLERIRHAQAPFFVIKGNWLHKLLRHLLNLPIRVFGKKQAFFDREALELLGLITTQLQSLHEEVSGHGTQRQRLRQEVSGQAKWLDVTSRKLEMLSMDVRERLGTTSALDNSLPEPRIIDAERYTERLAEMGGHIRVNVGCGEKPWPGYINVDLREVPDLDIVADARKLLFEQGTLAELASAHLVEHFREHQFRTCVLPYWKSLLKPDGVLRIICPNWAAMLERLHDGRMSMAAFKKVTFGAQDYEGDDHFAMYTPETLTVILNTAGFSKVKVKSKERMNGICPEMELTARL